MFIRRRVASICFVILLGVSNLSWGGCPEGQKMNDRSGSCEAIPGWKASGPLESGFCYLETGYASAFQKFSLDECDALGGVLFRTSECKKSLKAYGEKKCEKISMSLRSKLSEELSKKQQERKAVSVSKENKLFCATVDEAIEVFKTAFAEVNPEMADFVALMVENGWIDAAPSANKRLGAYCTKFAATRTPLVFMTWSGSRSDLMTLAHELGHAFHNWVMKDMPLCKTRYPMTLAETASIFAENIVRDYLLKQAKTRNEKLEMLWEELSTALVLMINTPVRFEFEKAFYEQREKGELTAQQLCDLMEHTWKEWYGDAMTEADPYFWASKLHFSISQVSFYNYPYLFGYLFSKGVYAQRDAKGEQFYDDYVSLLRDTGSMMAEEVVQKHLGMDLTKADFWQQSIDMVKVQIDEFERLLNQED